MPKEEHTINSIINEEVEAYFADNREAKRWYKLIENSHTKDENEDTAHHTSCGWSESMRDEIAVDIVCENIETEHNLTITEELRNMVRNKIMNLSGTQHICLYCGYQERRTRGAGLPICHYCHSPMEDKQGKRYPYMFSCMECGHAMPLKGNHTGEERLPNCPVCEEPMIVDQEQPAKD